ncbi:hypothetical protein PVAND_011123 [Polypedilum vanderplanki]|uniref:Uncharacterized protein n=1 Tax=Polypedilum vanderplanki TaxID=319348 RepID=A0A9J6CHN3_POLVA|nr:hypothetical protein PVAND_011123 [Polypedilum vanderplanki]
MNQAQSSIQLKKSPEIEFGYDYGHVENRETTTIKQNNIYSDIDDSSSVHFSDGDFIHHQSSVTLVIKNRDSHNNHNISLLCWILVLVLLLSILVSIVVVICVCIKAKRTRSKQEHRIATHINAFSPATNPSRHQSIEMLPKYVPSPAQSYSKLYQWCQQRDIQLQQQHYKSLWTVNPHNDDAEQMSSAAEVVDENPNAYKTRSLPSKNKQRPVSQIEDLDELYSRVNFSKKLRNRMTNNEAKIIAFCRSRSQNLSQYSNNSGGGSGLSKEEAFVVYDERTAL